jgi:hypothetical protein
MERNLPKVVGPYENEAVVSYLLHGNNFSIPDWMWQRKQFWQFLPASQPDPYPDFISVTNANTYADSIIGCPKQFHLWH